MAIQRYKPTAIPYRTIDILGSLADRNRKTIERSRKAILDSRELASASKKLTAAARALVDAVRDLKQYRRTKSA